MSHRRPAPPADAPPSSGRADQVCQARLSARDPVLIHAVAITDEDAGPVVDEGGKGLFGSAGMNHVERCRVTHHHPQPLEGMRQKPGRLINVVDQRAARLRGNRRVVRLDGLGHTVEDLLNCSQADGHVQHRRTKGLHDTPPVAVGPGYFAHERTEPWAIPRGMLSGHLGFAPAPAVRAPALVQHPVRHVHRDRRQLKHLMRMVRRGQGKRRVAACTLLGPHLGEIRGPRLQREAGRWSRSPCAVRTFPSVASDSVWGQHTS